MADSFGVSQLRGLRACLYPEWLVVGKVLENCQSGNVMPLNKTAPCLLFLVGQPQSNFSDILAQDVRRCRSKPREWEGERKQKEKKIGNWGNWKKEFCGVAGVEGGRRRSFSSRRFLLKAVMQCWWKVARWRDKKQGKNLRDTARRKRDGSASLTPGKIRSGPGWHPWLPGETQWDSKPLKKTWSHMTSLKMLVFQVSDWERPLESWGKRLAAGFSKSFQSFQPIILIFSLVFNKHCWFFSQGSREKWERVSLPVKRIWTKCEIVEQAHQYIRMYFVCFAKIIKKHYQLNFWFYIWYRGISTFVKDATALQLLEETMAGVQSLDSNGVLQ